MYYVGLLSFGPLLAGVLTLAFMDEGEASRPLPKRVQHLLHKLSLQQFDFPSVQARPRWADSGCEAAPVGCPQPCASRLIASHPGEYGRLANRVPVGQILIKELWFTRPINAPDRDAATRPWPNANLLFPTNEVPEDRLLRLDLRNLSMRQLAIQNLMNRNLGMPNPPNGDPAPLVLSLVSPARAPSPAELARTNQVVAPDGTMHELSRQARLLIMVKVHPDTPGTDDGWIYATADARFGRITAAGRLDACIQCHQWAPHDRLFKPGR